MYCAVVSPWFCRRAEHGLRDRKRPHREGAEALHLYRHGEEPEGCRLNLALGVEKGDEVEAQRDPQILKALEILH